MSHKVVGATWFSSVRHRHLLRRPSAKVRCTRSKPFPRKDRVRSLERRIQKFKGTLPNPKDLPPRGEWEEGGWDPFSLVTAFAVQPFAPKSGGSPPPAACSLKVHNLAPSSRPPDEATARSLATCNEEMPSLGVDRSRIHRLWAVLQLSTRPAILAGGQEIDVKACGGPPKSVTSN